MGNAGSMNQHTDPRGHHMPLKLPMPEQAELEERFALVLVCNELNDYQPGKKSFYSKLGVSCSLSTFKCVWIRL